MLDKKRLLSAVISRFVSQCAVAQSNQRINLAFGAIHIFYGFIHFFNSLTLD